MDAFNDIFGGLLGLNSEKYEKELDMLYWTDPEYYIYRVKKLKDDGYKIFRNSAGKHKVKGGMYYA